MLGIVSFLSCCIDRIELVYINFSANIVIKTQITCISPKISWKICDYRKIIVILPNKMLANYIKFQERNEIIIAFLIVITSAAECHFRTDKTDVHATAEYAEG